MKVDNLIKYDIVRVEKLGLVSAWKSIDLPEGAIPFHTEIWKYSPCSECMGIIPYTQEFNTKSYNRTTGRLESYDKDGPTFFTIYTRVYCLVPVSSKINRESIISV